MKFDSLLRSIETTKQELLHPTLFVWLGFSIFLPLVLVSTSFLLHFAVEDESAIADS